MLEHHSKIFKGESHTIYPTIANSTLSLHPKKRNEIDLAHLTPIEFGKHSEP